MIMDFAYPVVKWPVKVIEDNRRMSIPCTRYTVSRSVLANFAFQHCPNQDLQDEKDVQDFDPANPGDSLRSVTTCVW